MEAVNELRVHTPPLGGALNLQAFPQDGTIGTTVGQSLLYINMEGATRDVLISPFDYE